MKHYTFLQENRMTSMLKSLRMLNLQNKPEISKLLLDLKGLKYSWENEARKSLHFNSHNRATQIESQMEIIVNKLKSMGIEKPFDLIDKIIY